MNPISQNSNSLAGLFAQARLEALLAFTAVVLGGLLWASAASANVYHMLVGDPVRLTWSSDLVTSCEYQHSYTPSLLGVPAYTPVPRPVSGTLDIPGATINKTGTTRATLECRDASRNVYRHHSDVVVYPRLPVAPAASCSTQTDSNGNYSQITMSWQPNPLNPSDATYQLRIARHNAACPSGWSPSGNYCTQTQPSGATQTTFRAISGAQYNPEITSVSSGLTTVGVSNGMTFGITVYQSLGSVTCNVSGANISASSTAAVVYKSTPSSSHGAYTISGTITNLPVGITLDQNANEFMFCADPYNWYNVTMTGVNSATFSRTYTNQPVGDYNHQMVCRMRVRADASEQHVDGADLAWSAPINVRVSYPTNPGLCKVDSNPPLEGLGNDFCPGFCAPVGYIGLELYGTRVFMQNTRPSCSGRCSGTDVIYDPNNIADIPMCTASAPLTASFGVNLPNDIVGPPLPGNTPSTTISVPLGQDIQFVWSSTGAISCNTASSTGAFALWPNNTTLPTSGSNNAIRPPQAVGTYTARLYCSDGSNNISAIRSVRVNVTTGAPVPPPGSPSISSFTASASGVTAGTNISVAPNSTVTLGWSSTGATGCSISSSPAAGSDIGLGGNQTKNYVLPATPGVTYTYTLTCSATGLPNATRQVTVTTTGGRAPVGPGSVELNFIRN